MTSPASGAAHGLRQVSVPVDALDRAIAFYRDVLGLRLIASFGPIAFFDLGGVRLFLSPRSGDAVGSVLYLAVDDIASARAALVERGVTFDDEPHVIFHDETGTFGEPGLSEWMTFFRDSEGNQLALSSREPPAGE